MKKLSFALLFGSLLFFTSCSNTPTDELANTAPGTLTTSSVLSYDWGDINIQGGDVSHTFTFQNTGDGLVRFETATTSCMCTTATITLSNGEKSPAFGMHGSNSWGKYIAAGESASITVTFDPLAHGPNATGPISRKVYVATSAKADGATVMSSSESKDNILTLTVSGNVLSEEEYLSKK